MLYSLCCAEFLECVLKAEGSQYQVASALVIDVNVDEISLET